VQYCLSPGQKGPSRIASSCSRILPPSFGVEYDDQNTLHRACEETYGHYHALGWGEIAEASHRAQDRYGCCLRERSYPAWHPGNGQRGQLSSDQEVATLAETVSQECGSAARVHQQTRLRNVFVSTVGLVHLYNHFVRINVGVFYGVLTVHCCSHTSRMLQEQIMVACVAMSCPSDGHRLVQESLVVKAANEQGKHIEAKPAPKELPQEEEKEHGQ
jgi:hypothetical protein